MAGSVPLSVQVGRKLRPGLRRCSLKDEKISTLAPAPNLTIMTVERHEADWAVSVSGGDHAACPFCGVRSHSRHSSYRRTLRDLPAQGASVEVRARLTRWRCRNEQCERRIFAERIPGLAAPFSRRTTRLAGIVRLFGHSVGGRPSERLLARLGRACQDFRVWPELLNIFRSLPL